jgi:hypothetical protein
VNIKDILPTISPTGFLLGAALALAVGAVKVVVLDGIEARYAARQAEREAFSNEQQIVASRV